MLLLAACIAGPDSSSSSSASVRGNVPAAADPAKKTTICHIPPGNPANWHYITVGNSAVDAHLAHGDKIGACIELDGPGNVNTGNNGTSNTGENGGSNTNTDSNTPGETGTTTDNPAVSPS
jgi:hypothetical protein